MSNGSEDNAQWDVHQVLIQIDPLPSNQSRHHESNNLQVNPADHQTRLYTTDPLARHHEDSAVSQQAQLGGNQVPAVASAPSHCEPARHSIHDYAADHIARMARQNAALTLCEDIHDKVLQEDCRHIAHQVALLYQTLGRLGPEAHRLRHGLEEKFTMVKKATFNRTSNNTTFGLPHDLRDWLLDNINRIQHRIVTLELPPATKLTLSMPDLTKNGVS
eukprot:TRINITY_DN7471_c0_g1_i1.p1 TRINITY_DN7471_c0_g1~~TRINITY_DN7471_c0_g1_i1.p1  ORF type:complete len:218 (+),score=6.74 TRINITY_DN7471_c0_g1_i1:195-848(+)